MSLMSGKEEGYYTEERSEREKATLEEIPSPTIYLAALEEVPTWEEGELTIEEPKVDLDNLSEEERREVVKLLETKDELFARELDELTQTNKTTQPTHTMKQTSQTAI
ncbi:8139_t:CDS:2 [Acaulospora morrowiae]|uniref:8139_t:CDS:1 n=1 Tax=Acaulospora morrowiae TaxID=94023 RepID=A0A9N9GHX3_9GLOM|nr:8139_t:CDS:2 [Acaulospora morrowiae]